MKGKPLSRALAQKKPTIRSALKKYLVFQSDHQTIALMRAFIRLFRRADLFL